MKNINELNLEDLESVTGGFMVGGAAGAAVGCLPRRTEKSPAAPHAMKPGRG